MRYFIEFHHWSTGYVQGSNPPRFDGDKKLIPACGSDSVMPLDGRWGHARIMEEAERAAKVRGYPAFRIMNGSRFTEGKPISFVHVV